MLSKNIIKNALISVSDKSNIIEIAKILVQKKIKIFSTGGTANLLKKNNIPVIQVSHYTKFPEIMNGRIKTLHPKIIGGILGRKNQDKDVMNLHNILPMDIIIVNFYPFLQESKKNHNKNDNIINCIDIGGPTLVRAAAKNYKNVIVIVDTKDFQSVIKDINNNTMTIEKKMHLASKAFQYTSLYEKNIANFFIKQTKTLNTEKKNIFPNQLNLNFIKKNTLRYGENQHQKACLYIEKNTPISGAIISSNQIQGKLLSYNNIYDADIALECVKEFIQPACVIVKHGNPCGVAVKNILYQSYISAYQADSLSAFGGVVAFNSELDVKTAEMMIKNQFIEVIIAPKIEQNAWKILKEKTKIRILIYGNNTLNKQRLEFKSITNGILVQERDNQKEDFKEWYFVTKRMPTKEELKDAIFCWKIAKFVKSNAIVYGKNNVTLGIGAGQMSRIYSTKIANMKAKEQHFNTIGATMSSDAFFPFRDGVDSAASVGISCIIQPGGSIRDEEIIKAANEHNITMIFTNKRHFKH